MASDITITQVYLINNRLIVANNPIEAINIFNEYYREVDGYVEEIKSLKLVVDESYTCPSSNAFIRKAKKLTKEELKAWIVQNVRKSNLSDDALAESLYSTIYKKDHYV